jgi:Flp pilus assembly protein protease CpaA
VAILYLALFIPICISDIGSKTIPNVYLKILAYFTCIHLVQDGFPEADQQLIAALLLVGSYFLHIGMGDLKLLALLSLSFNSLGLEFVMLICVAATFHIVVSTARKRVIPQSIALAPSIFFAFATYLATR